jgi:hypothetical protein
MLGYTKTRAVHNAHWKHAEEDWIWQSVGVDANVPAPAISTAITFTVPAADHTTDGTGIPLRVGDYVEYDGGKGYVSVVVATTNAFVVTLAARTGYTYGAMTAGVTRVVPMYNSMGEKSTPIGSMSSDLSGFEFFAQTIREDHCVSGRSMAANFSWINWNGNRFWNHREIDNMYTRFDMRKERAVMIGDPTVAAVDPTATPMTGFIPWTITNGNIQPYGAAVTLTDLYALNDAADASKHGKRQFCIAGSQGVCRDLDNIVNNNFGGGAVFYGDADELLNEVLNLTFKGFMMDGDYSYIYKKVEEFTNPQGLGAPGLPYKDYGLVVPLDRTQTASTGSVPIAEVIHLSGDGENRREKLSSTGWNDGNNNDEKEFAILADMGTWPKLPEAWSLLRP